MIQRTALAAAVLATALGLSACTSPETPEEGATDVASATGDQSAAEGADMPDEDSPDAQTAHGELLDGFPSVIEQYPDSEILSSSMSPSGGGSAEESPAAEESASEESPAEEGGEESPAEESPAEDAGAGGDQVNAALVMRTSDSADDVLGFYEDSLEDGGFSPFRKASEQDGVSTQAFHAEDDGQTVSVSVGPDPDAEDQLLITVGGVVNR